MGGGTGMRDIGTLCGSSAFAADINVVGAVAGRSETASGERHAFLWEPERGMTDLGTLHGHTFSWAEGINSAGRVVGWSFAPGSPSGTSRAFLWQRGVGMIDLGTLPGG